MVPNGYQQRNIEKCFRSTDGQGKGLVSVRRHTKMPKLKENIEPKETSLTDVWKIGSTKAETKMSQGCHCIGDASTDLKVTEGVNI